MEEEGTASSVEVFRRSLWLLRFKTKVNRNLVLFCYSVKFFFFWKQICRFTPFGLLFLKSKWEYEQRRRRGRGWCKKISKKLKKKGSDAAALWPTTASEHHTADLHLLPRQTEFRERGELLSLNCVKREKCFGFVMIFVVLAIYNALFFCNFVGFNPWHLHVLSDLGRLI